MGTGAGPGWGRDLCLVWGAPQGGASPGVGVESPPAPEAQRKGSRMEPFSMHIWRSLQPRKDILGKYTLTSGPPQPSIQTPLETSASPYLSYPPPPPSLPLWLSPPVWAPPTPNPQCRCFLRKSVTQGPGWAAPHAPALAWLPWPHRKPKPLGLAFKAHPMSCSMLSASSYHLPLSGP